VTTSKETHKILSDSIKFFLLLIIFLINSCASNQDPKVQYAIVIHGGAGTITREGLSEEAEAEYTAKLKEALLKGQDILINGGDGIDVVESVIKIMEDSPLFNAGKGAVFTNSGTNELDASIMDGKNRNAGAVTGIKHLKNPISLARLVMEKSEHVMLMGEGAEEFAKQFNLEWVENNYFFTERRWKSLQKKITKKSKEGAFLNKSRTIEKFGTVGCVVLDKNGNLAAGTSTGGMTNKKYGRIGDTPIIGAGTYANNNTCAVSSTGHGEYFIRNTVAYDVSALMEYQGLTLQEASEKVIHDKLKKLGGTGGLIAIDNKGDIAMPFNTAGMFRGFIKDNGEIEIKMYPN